MGTQRRLLDSNVKKVILILTAVALTNLLISQTQDWFTYDVDSIISISMPNEVFEMDTTLKGVRIYQMSAHTGDATFVVQKGLIQEDATLLPHDLESLEEDYIELIDGMAKSMPFNLTSKKLTSRETFKGYHLESRDSLGNFVFEGEIYLLNKHLYSFFYSSLENFDKSEKDQFLNSLKINSDQNISQYLGKSRIYRIGYLIGNNLLTILIIGAIMYFLIRKRKKKG